MFFKKKKKATPATEDQRSELNAMVNAGLKGLSARLAAALSQVEKKLTVSEKKIAITSFCLIMGFVFLSKFYDGLSRRHSDGGAYLNTPSISTPVLPRLPDSILRRKRAPFKVFRGDSTKIDSITK